MVNGAGCATDGHGNYGAYERCTMRALVDLIATTTQWEVYNSGRSDGLRFYIDCDVAPDPYSCRYHPSSPWSSGAWYAGARRPVNVPMLAGQTFRWETNHYNHRAGFTLCSTLFISCTKSRTTSNQEYTSDRPNRTEINFTEPNRNGFQNYRTEIYRTENNFKLTEPNRIFGFTEAYRNLPK